MPLATGYSIVKTLIDVIYGLTIFVTGLLSDIDIAFPNSVEN